MKLDIYYPTLSKEIIQQNAAFEAGSLLSEVGGFLGLLLGASVLTVCELVDYLLLKCIRKIKTLKRDRNHVQVQAAATNLETLSTPCLKNTTSTLATIELAESDLA